MSPREKHLAVLSALGVVSLALYYIPTFLCATLILVVCCIVCYYHSGEPLPARLGLNPRAGLKVPAVLRRWLWGWGVTGVSVAARGRRKSGRNKNELPEAEGHFRGRLVETGIYRRESLATDSFLFSPRDFLMGSYIGKPESPTADSGRPRAGRNPREQLREKLSRPNHAVYTPNRRLSFAGEPPGTVGRFTITPQRHYPLQQPGLSSVGVLPPVKWDGFMKKNLRSPRNSPGVLSPVTVKIARPDHHSSPGLDHLSCAGLPRAPVDPCSRESVLKVLKESRKREVEDEDRSFASEQKSKRRRNDSGGSAHSAFEPLLPNGMPSQLVPKPGNLKRGMTSLAEDSIMKRSRTSSISSGSGVHAPRGTPGTRRNPIQSSYSSSLGLSQWKKRSAPSSPLSSPGSSRSQTPEGASKRAREDDGQSPSSASSVRSDQTASDKAPVTSKLTPAPAMSQRYQEEASGEAGEEQKVAPRSRQPNGTSLGEPPVRRSWRPCQMVNQDGEVNPHHHHHHHQPPHQHQPPTGRGPNRHRRRPPSGQGQAQSPGLGPAPAPSRPDGDESRDTEPRPVQQPRPAVTRYRRHGDPNPRLRGHRPRQPVREMQDSSPVADEREGPAEVQVQQRSSDDPVTDQLQDRGSPHLTPVTVVTPTHLSTGPATQNMQLHPQHTPPAEAKEDLQECKVQREEESEEIKENDKDQEQAEDDEDHRPTPGHSSCGRNDVQTVDDRAEEGAERVEEDQEEAMEDVAEDIAAQGSEITDLCSDTESAASLSMDAPLHSPPPLRSPTPPSSPEVPPFPQLDHFSEDTSMSPVPDNDLLPEDEDDDCSESCSLSHFTSRSDSYPKTYADFYTESHQKSYPEPVYKSYSEPKSHPNSFPEPLKTSYPELHREPRRQSGWRTETNEAQQESRQEPFTSHRQENVQKGAPSSPTRGSHYAPRQGRERGSHHSPLDRSVGCRLHHYDGQSDSEGDSADQSPVPKSRRQTPRQAETLAKSPSSGQSNSGERSAVSLQVEEGSRGSGDAISLAIKDIKEAIEEVKTKTVRSPYTPDQPVEPIWVMRQEVSPTEEVYPLPTTADHSSPHSPGQSASESPSRYASVAVREPVSPLRVESARALHPQHYPQQQPQHSHHPHHGHHSQQRDTARPPQAYTQPQPYATMPPNPHHQRQHQHQQQNQHHQQLPAQRLRPQVQPQAQVQPQPPPQQPTLQELRRSLPSFPTFVDVPGPCDPEDLIDGIIFAATYLGCTHLLSERTPTKSARMQQAQEAMSRVRAAQKQAKNRKKSPDGEPPSTAEVDLFMSTQRIKVLNADTQESLMDLPLRTISYIADIGNMVVLMARGKMVRSRSAQENLDHAAEQTTMSHDDRRLYRMICHVFESEDAQLIAQSIGQSFSVAYQEFLRANGIDPEDLSQREYSDLLNTQDMYNDDLIHFSKSENCRDVYIEKQKGEILGVVIVESGWGSILPTVIIASMMHAGPAEKSGRLNIGDQIMTINGTSLVGLPLSTCQSIIKGLKTQCRIKMNIVRCPPVTMVLIRRPDLRYQLGFSVQNGIICSLMRGGIAERGGVRVGHRIIDINSQSVVATPHEKIVQILSNAMGEIHMKTMPAAMYRLLTAQEQPVYI